MISIVIPTFNNLETCLQPCLESIIRTTDLQDVEVIVVANGCTDKTAEYVTNLGDAFKIIWFDEPLGFPKAVNQGIRRAKGEYIVLLNNDCVILDFGAKNMWIDMLRQPFLEDDKVGITGPLKLYSPQVKSDFIVFFCAMIQREMFLRSGYLDESFGVGAGEDTDFCMRVMKDGFKVVQVPSETPTVVPDGAVFNAAPFPIYHIGEATMNTLPNWKELFDHNTKLLEDKYKKYDNPLGIPNFDEYLYGEIYISNYYSVEKQDIEGRNVIDIGANIGLFSIYCEQFDPNHIIAVEPHPENYGNLVENVMVWEETHEDKMGNIMAVCSAVTDGTKKKVNIEGEGGHAHLSTNGHECEAQTLQEIYEMQEIYNDVDTVLKLDCEGAEFQILYSSSIELLRKFKIIFLEAHEIYDPRASIDHLISYMKWFGFELVWRANMVTTEVIDGCVVSKENTTFRMLKFIRIDL